VFDGKIGLWPLTETYTAKRDSVNRKKGTDCTRNVHTVDRQLYKFYLINHVIPAIKAKWPIKDRKNDILIQQDNAKPHLLQEDEDVISAGISDGWNIRLLFQPPNSPDLNVLDLGFFAAIQSIQYKQQIHGIDNLIKAVKNAFEGTKVSTLDDIFLALQACMSCILECDGGNEYKLPHLGKASLRNRETLPSSLHCDRALFDRATSLVAAVCPPTLL
jgi:hypothetical protein